MQRSRPLLGTYVTVSVYATDRADGVAAISETFKEFARVDQLLSIHRDDTELSRLNRNAARGAVEVSEELFNLLDRVLRISRETGGAFDPTIRPLTDLWGFIWKEHRLPTTAELQDTLPQVDFRAVQLDRDRRTVRYLKPGLSIDPGGFGKGYAVDCALARLEQRGISRALVKAGGDVRVIGTPPGRDAWPIQIEDPNKLGNRVTVPVRNAALSTSGNYENFFIIDGRRYSHILDPRTGLPVDGIAACSVIAPTCLESDLWATAMMVIEADTARDRPHPRFATRLLRMPADTTTEWQVEETNDFPKSIDP